MYNFKKGEYKLAIVLMSLYLFNNTVFFCIIILFTACNGVPDKEEQTLSVGGETVNGIYINTLDSSFIDQTIAIADSEQLAGNHHRAKELFWETARNAKVANYPMGLTRSISKLISIFVAEQKYDSALKFYHLAMPYARRLPKEYCYPELLHTLISWSYNQQGKTDSALWYCYKSIKEIDTHPITAAGYKNAFFVYQTIGAIWHNIGHEDIAGPYLAKAGTLAIKTKDSAILAMYVNIQASMLFRMKHLENARILYQKVLANKQTAPGELIEANHNLGLIYASKGALYQPEKAIHHFSEALRILQQINGSSDENEEYLFELACCYVSKGADEKNEADLRKAIDIFKSINRSSEKSFAANSPWFYYNYSVAYANLQDYKNAYETILKSVNVRDSIYNKEKLKTISKLEIQYHVAEKDKQIAQQRMWLIAIISGTVLLLGTVIVFLKRRQHRAETARLKAMLAGAEHERGRLARELHDGILSSLSAIKMKFSMLTSKDFDKTSNSKFQQTLNQLEYSINELRTTSHNLYPDILKQEGLANATSVFCKKMTNITGVGIEFQMLGIIPQLPAEFELELYRMIQELVQNIIKHAEATHALVQIHAEEDRLSITIDDNGKGISKEHLARTDGMGLARLKNRIHSMNGNFYMESDNGTSIYIDFDLKHQQHEQ